VCGGVWGLGVVGGVVWVGGGGWMVGGGRLGVGYKCEAGELDHTYACKHSTPNQFVSHNNRLYSNRNLNK